MARRTAADIDFSKVDWYNQNRKPPAAEDITWVWDDKADAWSPYLTGGFRTVEGP